MAKVADPDGMALFSLSLYFVMAERSRNSFLESLAEKRENVEWNADTNAFWLLWYASLRTVVEGWGVLGLHDETVDALLESPMTPMLNHARNKIMHFQKTYPPKEVEAFTSHPNHVAWVNDLTDAFGVAIYFKIRDHDAKLEGPPAASL